MRMRSIYTVTIWVSKQNVWQNLLAPGVILSATILTATSNLKNIQTFATFTSPTATMAPTLNPTPLFRLLTPFLQTFRSMSSSPLRQTTRSFSSTPQLSAKRFERPKKDPRITLIRYHLQHPKTPRPLRLSRMRALRHWTIHRAWMLTRRRKFRTEELELQRFVSLLFHTGNARFISKVLYFDWGILRMELEREIFAWLACVFRYVCWL